MANKNCLTFSSSHSNIRVHRAISVRFQSNLKRVGMSLMLRIIHYSSPFVDLAVFGLQNSLFLLIARFLLINTRYISGSQ